ncbi:MAG: DKNYY domain-containing protein [Rubrivivax sp.]|nr:DKNYY domain-containing protein [Rubrivivax sp.]
MFATDGQRVFCTRGALKEVDAATFKVVEESLEPDIEGSFVSAYAVTPHKAVYVDQLCAPRFFQPKDVASLRVLAPHFATDGIGVYYDGVKISGADPGSFKPLTSNYSLDRRYCYFRSARIVHAKTSSFRILGGADDRGLFLSHDEDSLYFCEQPVLKLSGFVPELRRGEGRCITGVFDGERVWTTSELDGIYRTNVRKYRSVVFSDTCSTTRFTDASFAGLEDDLAMFLMLCTHKTVQALEEFTRGKRGERALVRSIERLNSQLPVKLAVVSPTAINITSEGVAAYRQYGAVADVIGSFVAALKR